MENEGLGTNAQIPDAPIPDPSFVLNELNVPYGERGADGPGETGVKSGMQKVPGTATMSGPGHAQVGPADGREPSFPADSDAGEAETAATSRYEDEDNDIVGYEDSVRLIGYDDDDWFLEPSCD